MLMPKKVKYRKQQRGRMAGKAWRGSDVSFGDYGLKAMEPCWMTARQIEAARVAMTRFIKRGGKIWVRVFPDKPITKKPQETRMGKGKGAPEEWVCVVRPGRILFEMEGVSETDARARDAAGRGQAADQDEVRDAVRAGDGVMKIGEIRELGVDDLQRAREGPRRSAVPAPHPEVDGPARGAGQAAHAAPRPGAHQDDSPRAAEVGSRHERQGTADRHGGQRQDGKDGGGRRSSARCATASTARSSAAPRSSSPTTRATRPRRATR